MVLEKTLESPLDGKIKPVNPIGNQPWIFIGRTDAEAEASVLWLPDAKSQLIGKHSDPVKDWSQRSGQQRMRWLNSITNSMNMCGFHIVKDRGTWHATIHWVVQTQQLNNNNYCYIFLHREILYFLFSYRKVKVHTFIFSWKKVNQLVRLGIEDDNLMPYHIVYSYIASKFFFKSF